MIIKKLITLPLLLVSTAVFAESSLDVNNTEHMQYLGFGWGCSQYYDFAGETTKARVLDIAFEQEIDSDWNKLRNKTMNDTASKVFIDLLGKGDQSKYYKTCDKLYNTIKELL